MVRYLHGRDESFPWVAHVGILMLRGLEIYWSTHDMHLDTIYGHTLMCYLLHIVMKPLLCYQL